MPTWIFIKIFESRGKYEQFRGWRLRALGLSVSDLDIMSSRLEDRAALSLVVGVYFL
jgi:hypothetical protein